MKRFLSSTCFRSVALWDTRKPLHHDGRHTQQHWVGYFAEWLSLLENVNVETFFFIFINLQLGICWAVLLFW